MNVFEFVIAIMLVVTIGSVLRSRGGHAGGKRRKRHEDEPPPQAASGPSAEERFRALEERIAVLERIVTDRGYELRQKFRDLE